MKKAFLSSITSVLMISTIFVTLANAGAWTQKKNHFYLKFGLLRFKATSQYQLDGERITLSNNGEVLDLSVYGYLEYGLYDDVTLIFVAPAKRTSFNCAIEECDRASQGIGDLSVGFRYRLSNARWVVSLQSILKFATGYETDETVLNSAPPLGDGQTDFQVGISVGRPMLAHRAYINFDAAYRARAGEPVDEVPFALEVGLNLTEHYVLSSRLHGVRSISEDALQQNFSIVDGMVQNFVGTGAVEDFLKLQIQFAYRMHRNFDLAFGFDQVLTGRNTSRASTIGIGFAIHK